MYKDALNGLFFTDTAESPLISRVTGNSKVALQIQPITQQGKGLEKRARKYIEDENKFLKKKKTHKKKKQNQLLQCAMRSNRSHWQINRNHFLQDQIMLKMNSTP